MPKVYNMYRVYKLRIGYLYVIFFLAFLIRFLFSRYIYKLCLGIYSVSRGAAAVKFLVGQKKIAKKGSIFFPICAKNNFESGKKKYLVRQTPKLIHSR